NSVASSRESPSCRGPGSVARPGGRSVGHRSSVVEVDRPETVTQESVNDKIGDLAAQLLTRRKVEPEMLSSENPAQRRLLRGIAERAERTRHSGEDLRRNAEGGMILPEEGRQHAGSRGAEDGVRAWIGGVRRGLARLRKPI